MDREVPPPADDHGWYARYRARVERRPDLIEPSPALIDALREAERRYGE